MEHAQKASHNDLLYALAAKDNELKRTDQRIADARTGAVRDVLLVWIGSIDTFELAVGHMLNTPVTKGKRQGEAQACRDGLDLALRYAWSSLEQFGVVRYVPNPGVTFDAHWHHAVEMRCASISGKSVDRCVKPGYEWGGAALRPAHVVVLGS